MIKLFPILLLFSVGCACKTKTVKIPSATILEFYKNYEKNNFYDDLRDFAIGLKPLRDYEDDNTWAIYRITYIPHLLEGWVVTIKGSGDVIHLEKKFFTGSILKVRLDIDEHGTTKKNILLKVKECDLDKKEDIEFLKGIKLADFPDGKDIKNRPFFIGQNHFNFEVIENEKENFFGFSGILKKGGTHYDEVLLKFLDWLFNKI